MELNSKHLEESIRSYTRIELDRLLLIQLKSLYSTLGYTPGIKRRDELVSELLRVLPPIIAEHIQGGGNLWDITPLNFSPNGRIFKEQSVRNIIDGYSRSLQAQKPQRPSPKLNLPFHHPNGSQTHTSIDPANRCFCNQSIDDNTPSVSTIRCANSKCCRQFHRFCMKLISPNEEYPLFECPYCVLSKCDPLHQTLKVLVPPFVVDNQRRDFAIDDEAYRNIKTNEHFGIEIRSIKLEEKCHEQCWPNYGELILNQLRYLEFKPLQQNSSLKRRKDEKFFTQDIRIGINSFYLKYIAMKNDQKNRKNEETYICAVYFVRRLSCDELVLKIKQESRRSMEDCKKIIWQNMEGSGLDINKLSYPPTCVFDMQLLKTPAKGIHCKHINCFSLENFISVWQKNGQRKWSCPICKLKAYEIVVDTYFEKIMRDLMSTVYDDPTDVSVEISRNATYKFVLDDNSMGSDEEEKPQPKQNKLPEKMSNMIILDESDEEIPTNSTQNKIPTLATQTGSARSLVKEDTAMNLENEKVPSPMLRSVRIEETQTVVQKPPTVVEIIEEDAPEIIQPEINPIEQITINQTNLLQRPQTQSQLQAPKYPYLDQQKKQQEHQQYSNGLQQGLGQNLLTQLATPSITTAHQWQTQPNHQQSSTTNGNSAVSINPALFKQPLETYPSTFPYNITNGSQLAKSIIPSKYSKPDQLSVYNNTKPSTSITLDGLQSLLNIKSSGLISQRSNGVNPNENLISRVDGMLKDARDNNKHSQSHNLEENMINGSQASTKEKLASKYTKEKSEKDIERLMEYYDSNLELPNFGNFKLKKYTKRNVNKENRLQRSKKLISLMVTQIPILKQETGKSTNTVDLEGIDETKEKKKDGLERNILEEEKISKLDRQAQSQTHAQSEIPSRPQKQSQLQAPTQVQTHAQVQSEVFNRSQKQPQLQAPGQVQSLIPLQPEMPSQSQKRSQSNSKVSNSSKERTQSLKSGHESNPICLD